MRQILNRVAATAIIVLSVTPQTIGLVFPSYIAKTIMMAIKTEAERETESTSHIHMLGCRKNGLCAAHPDKWSGFLASSAPMRVYVYSYREAVGPEESCWSAMCCWALLCSVDAVLNARPVSSRVWRGCVTGKAVGTGVYSMSDGCSVQCQTFSARGSLFELI
jgi:hypothetical protein